VRPVHDEARLPERDGPLLRLEQAEERVHHDAEQEPQGRLLAAKPPLLPRPDRSGKKEALSQLIKSLKAHYFSVLRGQMFF